jgi:arginine-tRNA-protein transferase
MGALAGPEMIRQLFALTVSKEPCKLIPGRQSTVETITMRDYFNRRARPALGNMLRLGFHKDINGFGRSNCDACNACKPIRLRADLFRPGRTHRRIVNANADLTIEKVRFPYIDEHVDLYTRNRRDRFPDRETDGSERLIILSLLGNSRFPASVLEFRRNGRLVGTMVYDALDDGLSAISSYYDPALSRGRSLGTFMILELARRVRESGKRHLYLGTWTDEPTRYSYKARFRPAEIMTRDGRWTPLK